MKKLGDYFADWEARVFGFGYGTGEEHTLGAVKTFLETVGKSGRYDYDTMENACGKNVAWLLINTFCHADIIEYGMSPRYGWLTKEGCALKVYFDSKSIDQILEDLDRDESYTYCFPDLCQCGETPCNNPFWRQQKSPTGEPQG
jgi:hypothetical protein